MASAELSAAWTLQPCLDLRLTLSPHNQDAQQFGFDRSGSVNTCLPLAGPDIPETGCLSDFWMCIPSRSVGIANVSPTWFPIAELYRVDFLPGQYFDIRLEVHAPINGSQATGNSVPDSSFTFAIAKAGGQAQSAASYFGISEPSVEHWKFTWFEGNAFHASITHVEYILSSLQIYLPEMPRNRP
jgi:hypothetical protein